MPRTTRRAADSLLMDGLVDGAEAQLRAAARRDSQQVVGDGDTVAQDSPPDVEDVPNDEGHVEASQDAASLAGAPAGDAAVTEDEEQAAVTEEARYKMHHSVSG